MNRIITTIQKYPKIFIFCWGLLGASLPCYATKSDEKVDAAAPSEVDKKPRNLQTKKRRRWGILAGIGCLVVGIKQYFSSGNRFRINLEKVHCQTYFYRITSDDSDNISYLYGTTHMKYHDFDIPSVVKEIIPDIDQIVLEGNLNQDQYFRQMREGVWEHLLKLYEANKSAFIKSKPFFDHLQDYQKKEKLRFVYGAEMITIAWEAKIKYPAEMLIDLCQEKELGGLETAQEITHLLNQKNNSVATMAQQKYDKILSFEKSNATLDSLRKKYGTYNFCTENNTVYGVLKKKDPYIAPRNEKWITKMVEAMDQQSVLFAVGIAHFPSAFGLLYSLLNHGKKITRIHLDGREEVINLSNYNDAYS